MNPVERDKIINQINSSLDNCISMLDELIQIEHTRRQRRAELWDDIWYYTKFFVGAISSGVILWLLLRLLLK